MWLVKTMSVSEFNDFSMSNWSKIQWFFYDFFILTNFKNFSSNSMIFPWSWNRSEFQWFFKSCGNPDAAATEAQHQSKVKFTTDTSSLAPSGKQWGVSCGYLEKIEYLITASQCHVLPGEVIIRYDIDYCQTFNIWHTKSQHLNGFCLILQLSMPNPLKPGVECCIRT